MNKAEATGGGLLLPCYQLPNARHPHPPLPSFLSLCKCQLSGWGAGLISPIRLLHARQYGARSVCHPGCQQTGLHRLLHPDAPLVLQEPGLDVLCRRERAPEPVGRFGETLLIPHHVTCLTHCREERGERLRRVVISHLLPPARWLKSAVLETTWEDGLSFDRGT